MPLKEITHRTMDILKYTYRQTIPSDDLQGIVQQEQHLEDYDTRYDTQHAGVFNALASSVTSKKLTPNYINQYRKKFQVDYYCYKEEGSIVGIAALEAGCRLQILRPYIPYRKMMASKIGKHVTTLVIDPKYRHQGIGTKLLDYIEEHETCKYLTIACISYNDVACNMYIHRKFIDIESSVYMKTVKPNYTDPYWMSVEQDSQFLTKLIPTVHNHIKLFTSKIPELDGVIEIRTEPDPNIQYLKYAESSTYVCYSVLGKVAWVYWILSLDNEPLTSHALGSLIMDFYTLGMKYILYDVDRTVLLNTKDLQIWTPMSRFLYKRIH